MKYLFCVFCVALSCLGLGASAQDISFDIYEIRIGDSPEEVDEAMARAGFELKTSVMGDKEYERSFEDQRQIRLGELEPRDAERNAVRAANYISDRGRVAVKFMAWPEGSSVTDVFFYPNSEFLDCETFKAAAEERFGQGIPVSEGWTDTAGEPDGSTTVWVKCGMTGSLTLHLFMRNARKIHTELLSVTDPEPEMDF